MALPPVTLAAHGPYVGDLDAMGYVLEAGAVTDNALVRWDGITGRVVQNSTAILTDAGALTTASVTGSSYLAQGAAPPNAGSVRLDGAATINATTSHALQIGGTTKVTVGTAGTVVGIKTDGNGGAQDGPYLRLYPISLTNETPIQYALAQQTAVFVDGGNWPDYVLRLGSNVTGSGYIDAARSAVWAQWEHDYHSGGVTQLEGHINARNTLGTKTHRAYHIAFTDDANLGVGHAWHGSSFSWLDSTGTTLAMWQTDFGELHSKRGYQVETNNLAAFQQRNKDDNGYVSICGIYPITNGVTITDTLLLSPAAAPIRFDGACEFASRTQASLGGGTYNNVALSAANQAYWVTPTAAGVYITGFDNEERPGRIVWVFNLSDTHPVTLKHYNAGSAFGNKIICPDSKDVVIPPRGGTMLYFVPDGIGWHVADTEARMQPDGTAVQVYDAAAGAWRTVWSSTGGALNVGDANDTTKINGSALGFFTTAPVAKPTVAGVKADAVAASILAALVALGLVTDTTT